MALLLSHLHRPRIRRPAARLALSLGLLPLLALALGVGMGGAQAHPGKLDEFGGHFAESGYHYHKPKWNLSHRAKEQLRWEKAGEDGELIGKVTQVDRPGAVWVRLDYRPAFHQLSEKMARAGVDTKSQSVLVWLNRVAPEASVLNQDKAYRDWFSKKVVYELDRKLKNQPVTVQFRIHPASGRMSGMVFMGKENINLWLVLSGWSYYKMNGGENTHEKTFVEAEELAKKNKAGLWERQ